MLYHLSRDPNLTIKNSKKKQNFTRRTYINE